MKLFAPLFALFTLASCEGFSQAVTENPELPAQVGGAVETALEQAASGSGTGEVLLGAASAAVAILGGLFAKKKAEQAKAKKAAQA